MNSFRYRPLAVFSITFYISACAFAAIDSTLPLIITAAAGFALTVLFIILNIKTRVSIVPTLVLFALSFAALFSLVTVLLPKARYEKLVGEKLVTGEIVKTVWADGERGIFIADATIDGKDVRLYLSSNELLTRGDVFCASAEVNIPDDSMNYYRTEGVDLAASAKNVEIIEKGDNKIFGVFYDLNRRLSAVFIVKLGRENGGFASSVLLGNRTNLSNRLYADLKSMGITHLIALSGLHLSVICGIVYVLTRFLGKKISTVAAMATAVFYVFLTDFSASIVRASVMLMIFCTIRLLKRSADGATTIGITALAVTLFSPKTVFDVGFQLSCAAVAGVFCALDYMKGKWYDEPTMTAIIVKKAVTPLAVGLGATLFVLPVLLINCNSVTFAGALITVPMAALLTVIMWMLPALLVLPFDFYRDTVNFLIDTFERAAEYFSELGDFRLLCKNYVLGAIICGLAAFGLVLVLTTEKKKVKMSIFAASVLLLCVFTGMCVEEAALSSERVAVIGKEYDNGDALILQENGLTVVLDVTSASRTTYESLAEIVLSLGDTEIDALIIADPGNYHFSALAKSRVLYGIDVVFMPENNTSRQLAYRMKDYTEVIFYREGTEISFGEITVKALPTMESSRSTLPSLAFAAEINGETVVYAGSAYEELGGEIPECDRLWRGSYGPKENE